MAALDELMTNLRADGVVDSQGRFTLDREQARSKMQRFALADARLYVLELVQGAVLRDATAIRFDIDADDMRMRFDGHPFTPTELDDLYGSVFGEGEGRRFESVRQLAVAFNAALSMNISHIELRSGSLRLTIRPGREDTIAELSPPHEGTTIHVRRRFRLGVVVDFFRNIAGRLDEEQYLRERCGHATIPIDLEGKILSRGLGGIPDSLLEIPFAGEGFRGVVALVASDRPAQLRLVKAGVWIDTHEAPSCGTHIVAVVEGDALRKDLSQARIVSDAALEAVIGAVRGARWQLWLQASRAATEGGLAQYDVYSWIRTQIFEHATRSEIQFNPHALALTELVSWLDCRDPFLSELPSGLRELSTVRSPAAVAARPRVTLRQLLETSSADPPEFATRGFDALMPSDPPVILLSTQEEIDRLRRLLPGLRNRTKQLTQAERKEQARLAWLSRAGEPELPEHVRLLAHESIDLPGIRGRIGIDARILEAPASSYPMHAMLFTNGCLLASLELELRVPGLWLAVEADFEPTELYDDAVRDARFAEVLLACIAGLREAMADAHEIAVDGEHEPAVLGLTRRLSNRVHPTQPLGERARAREASVRGLVKRWLASMLVVKYRRSLLRSLGVAKEIIAKWDEIGFELIPGLAPHRLLGDEVDPIAQLPLFVDFANQPTSLRALALAKARDGELRYLPWATEIAPIPALPGILRLGPTDTALLEAIFGASALVPWLDELATKQALARHMTKPIVDLDRALQDARAEAEAATIDPELWIARAPDHRGWMSLAYAPGTDSALRLEDMLYCHVEIYREGRHLTTLELDLGVGLLLVVVEDPALTPTADWEGVVDDAALHDLHAALRTCALAHMKDLCASFADLPFPVRRWLRTVLLLDAAKGVDTGDPAMLEHVRELPILPTVDGREISIAEAMAVLELHGRLETVDDEHPPAVVAAPPILALDRVQRSAVEILLGNGRLVDGTSRIRLEQAKVSFGHLPAIADPVLDATEVLVRESLQRPRVRGEVGLAHRRSGGLRLKLCTAGRLVGVVEDASHIPIDAILSDDELPIDHHTELDTDHKRVRGHLRACRRRLPQMISTLTREVSGALAGTGSSLAQRDLDRASELLLHHAIHERDSGESRRNDREVALRAVTALPLFTDIWGQRRSIQQIGGFAGAHGVDVLERMRPEMPEGETAEVLGRLILALSPLERQCLERFYEVRVINSQWEDESAALERLRSAPPVVIPDLESVAIVERKAQVAGALEAIVWIPRDYDPLDLEAEPTMVFANGERELCRQSVLSFLPCFGVVRGPGLRATASGVSLDDRQRTSLERQIVVLYDVLTDAVRGRRLARNDQALAAAVLARAAFELETQPKHPAIRRLGKRIEQLRRKLDDPKVAPPMLLDALRTAKASPAPPPRGERPLELEPAVQQPLPPEALPPEPRPEPSPRADAVVRPTPEQALLAELDAQLHWARARHASLLDELGLATMTIGDGPGQGIATLGPRGIVIRRDHPIVTRLLHQQPFDPFDLAFVLVAIYSLLNARTVKIDDDDEREFVGQLAQTLTMMARARPRPAST
jgi:hypothetical protein